jgi:hypothetical protein
MLAPILLVIRITSTAICKDVSYKNGWDNVVFASKETARYSVDYVANKPVSRRDVHTEDELYFILPFWHIRHQAAVA